MKSHSRVVIVGGGMMGVGLLYHLALEGWDDCILLEKGTSGAYGHTVGKQLIFAYVKPEKATPHSTFDIEILAERYRAEVLPEPIFDPENERPRS